ncbi:hypothetical protein HC891_16640 [Candidatus Gracilibacteria bacterium]|nr:hypothetical protein [Candidatus Gracilibacteria bacterium]
MTAEISRELLGNLDVPYIVAQPLFVQDEAHWRAHGVGPLQSTMLYSLPEMDGAIAPVVLGGMQGNEISTVPDRVERLATLARRFVLLRKTENRRKKWRLWCITTHPAKAIPPPQRCRCATQLDPPARRACRCGLRCWTLPTRPGDLCALPGGDIGGEKSEFRIQDSEAAICRQSTLW